MPKDPLAKTKFLAPEALRGLGGILLNHEGTPQSVVHSFIPSVEIFPSLLFVIYKGRRFVNELETRDRVTDAIFKNCHPMRVPLESGKNELI